VNPVDLLAFAPGGFHFPLPVITLGILSGIVYGLLAVGLVLIYRTNRIINFAHGQIGVFAAAVFELAVHRWHIPYYGAFPLALALGGAVGVAAEVAVVRRLRNAPRLVSVVATLGVGQFLVSLAFALNGEAGAGTLFPQPPGLPTFHLGALELDQAYVGMLIFGPLVVIGLGLFLNRTRYGMALQSAAANPEAARMAGIFAARMSGLAWALAGALSALTAILVLPTNGFSSGASFGPSLLVIALAAGVLAKMSSLPRALLAGIALGVLQQLLLWNYSDGGLVEVVLFGIILVALMLQRRPLGREDEKGSWAAVEAWKPIPEELKSVWAIRHLGAITAGVAVAVTLAISVGIDNSNALILVGVIGFTIVGLSVGILTGLGGNLTLGQFGVAAIGAVVSAQVASHTGNYVLAFVYAGVAGAVVSALLGLPSLRVRGLFLTVTSLAFALVVPTWLLGQSWALGASGKSPGRPSIAGAVLGSDKAYLYFALVVVVLTFIVAGNVRSGSFGRMLVALRDNEDAARSFSVRAAVIKVQGFLLAGFIAGVGGAVYGHALTLITSDTFPVDGSINVAAMTVVGGMSVLAGPLLGALYIIALPAFVNLSSAAVAATSLGWLVLILYVPGGLAQLVRPIRNRLVTRLAARAGIAVDERPHAETGVVRVHGITVAATAVSPRRPDGAVLLEAEQLRKNFGGVAAVDDVSLEVRAGETLGLIGPNGAGKTTVFEILGGFTRPDAGTVRFDGMDVGRMGPEARARMGLIRSFQDAALFPAMTVTEAVSLALERIAPGGLLRSCVGLRGPERRKTAAARDLIGQMGLFAYRDAQIRELSTGTRRITELACLIALRPTLLLLDEPSSGIAQRETEALGDLLNDVKRSLDVTLVIIEHDIPLIMSLADRLVVLDAGRLIASGPPEIVRTDAKVVEAYLGGSMAAIERSGPRRLATRPPRRTPVRSDLTTAQR